MLKDTARPFHGRVQVTRWEFAEPIHVATQQLARLLLFGLILFVSRNSFLNMKSEHASTSGISSAMAHTVKTVLAYKKLC